jgi:hypothetical protein
VTFPVVCVSSAQRAHSGHSSGTVGVFGDTLEGRRCPSPLSAPWVSRRVTPRDDAPRLRHEAPTSAVYFAFALRVLHVALEVVVGLGASSSHGQKDHQHGGESAHRQAGPAPYSKKHVAARLMPILPARLSDAPRPCGHFYREGATRRC